MLKGLMKDVVGMVFEWQLPAVSVSQKLGTSCSLVATRLRGVHEADVALSKGADGSKLDTLLIRRVVA